MKKKNITIDDLARMVAKGFGETAKKADIDVSFDRIEKRLDTLERGHDEIKLRLDNVAYRFELVELQRRVEILEKRSGIKQK
jgi:hypothetical protein